MVAGIQAKRRESCIQQVGRMGWECWQRPDLRSLGPYKGVWVLRSELTVEAFLALLVMA